MRRGVLSGILTLFLILVLVSFSFAKTIYLNDAIQAGENFLSAQKLNLPTTKFSSETQVCDLIQNVQKLQIDGRLIAYILNLNPVGYVVISPDTNIRPIIAYSFKNDFPIEDTPENVLLHLLKWDMENRLDALPITAVDLKEKNIILWEKQLSQEQIYSSASLANSPWGPLIETDWDQDDPYNKYCPCLHSVPFLGSCITRGVVGCVATAMAQIVNYWGNKLNYPESVEFNDGDRYTAEEYDIEIDGDSEDRDFPDFEELNNLLSDLKYDGDEDEIAALNFACGISVEMDYTTWWWILGPESLAYTIRVAHALQNKFNYDSAIYRSVESYGNFYNDLTEDIKNQQPAQIEIGKEDDEEGGHAVIVDGFKDTGEYHLNFGWGGSNDGWYFLPAGMPSGYNVVRGGVLNINPQGEPEEFYLLSGTLTDAQGSSVPGWIYAYETSGANLGNRVYVAANEIYKMALFPGNYNVYADAYPEVTYGSTRIRTPLQNIDMTKDETLNFQIPSYDFYHLTGKVTDITGVELANVSVQAYNNSGVCYSSARTDSNGIYNISLIAGTYFLNFRPPNNSGFLDKRLDNIQINNDFTQDTFLASSEQYKLSGTVTGISGIFDYINVNANEIGGTNYGSASPFDGAYEMALFPGTYRVVAYAYKYNYYDGNYIGYTSITAPYQTISILDDAEIDIQVPSYDFYHLSGKVTDINDVIQPNVNIQAYDSTGVCQGYTTTNSNGNYDLLLSPGTYRLRITAPPATYPPFEIKRIFVSEDSIRNIRLSLEYTLLEEALALLATNLDLALDVFDIIDQATILNYDISVQGAKGLLQIILNWAGSEMKVTLYNPNGNVYGEYQSTEPPINVEIPNPTEGTWKCEVTALDVPHDNYPFALVAGISPNESPVADANGPYSGAVDSPITFDASGSYDPDGNIVSYEWDWDGNGNFDESTDSATITHTWNEIYSGSIILMVKDNEGATSTDSAYVEVDADSLLAEVDINPDVLNLKSKGNWVTSYIELPEGYAAENIDVNSVTMEGIISAELSPTQVGDHDDDGVPDLMVKFDRQVLIGYLEGATGEVTLTLTGDVDGKPFEGSDTIIVLGKE